jgi:hypothetical protein
VPFIYLAAPTSERVGVYSTIPVLGATQWVAPLWIGLPVQWCGLVYGHAIRRLATHDPAGPWKQLADGIALAGVQQTHPASEPAFQGLLPDSFELRHQVRNPVPINPATLLVEALQAYGEEPIYDFHAFHKRGLLVHAAGRIQNPIETQSGVQFAVRPWHRSYVLLNGLDQKPHVRVNGSAVEPQFFGDFERRGGHAIIQVKDVADVQLEFR